MQRLYLARVASQGDYCGLGDLGDQGDKGDLDDQDDLDD